MKRFSIIGIVVFLIVGGGLLGHNRFTDGGKPRKEPSIVTQTEPGGFNKSLHSLDEPGSMWWIVNKKRPMPSDYTPAGMVAPDMKLRWAADAETMQVSKLAVPSLESMAKAAKGSGLELMLISGFRSAKFQKELYDTQVAQYGQAEADRQSAKPGTSEHQTGLAIDLGRADKECELTECFGGTPEGKWLADHAHEHGFIIRYLENKETRTGYMYEPWHLRYVGKELATELKNKQQTMEEFFNL